MLIAIRKLLNEGTFELKGKEVLPFVKIVKWLQDEIEDGEKTQSDKIIDKSKKKTQGIK